MSGSRSQTQDRSARLPTRSDIEVAFARYRELIADWPAFIDALRRPHVPCVWANELRISRDALATLLVEEGLQAQPVSWARAGFRLPSTAQPGSRWPYQVGLYQVQEESSMLPVRLLDPQPGDRVLDLCAAPGNKTAQIAVALGGRGTVVANDHNRHRLAAVQNAIARLGLCNVAVTRADGRTFPAQEQPFDRVLVDVPCSAEGTLRKTRSINPRTREFSQYIRGTQAALLRRAVCLTRPGGRIVYSTCTFAPEENEMVIESVMSEMPGALRIVPIDTRSGLPGSSGVTEWRGRQLAAELADCRRLWPHQTGTGGFFVAVLERTREVVADPLGKQAARPTRERPWRPIPALEHEQVVACLSRYGMPSEPFRDLCVAQSGRHLRFTVRDHQPPDHVYRNAIGLAAMPAKAAQPRWSTAGVLAFGARATRHVVDVSAEQAQAYLQRRSTALQTLQSDSRGFVIDRHPGHIPLGNAQIGQHADGAGGDNPGIWLHSRFPRAWIRSVDPSI